MCQGDIGLQKAFDYAHLLHVLSIRFKLDRMEKLKGFLFVCIFKPNISESECKAFQKETRRAHVCARAHTHTPQTGLISKASSLLPVII